MKKKDLEETFIAMLKENERVIYKVCSFYASEESPLCDLYQDVVCNLWTAYPKFRGECSISTWIYRIALNTCISGFRKKKMERSADLSSLQDAFIPDSAIEKIIMNFIQAFSPPNQVRMSIPHPCGMGLK